MVCANGGLATTRNGRRAAAGRPVGLARPTTSSPANRRRSAPTRCGCSSTAITRAPAATSGAVTAPVPAPMSRTRSPGDARVSYEPCRPTTARRCHPHRSVPGARARRTITNCHGPASRGTDAWTTIWRRSRGPPHVASDAVLSPMTLAEGPLHRPPAVGTPPGGSRWPSGRRPPRTGGSGRCGPPPTRASAVVRLVTVISAGSRPSRAQWAWSTSTLWRTVSASPNRLQASAWRATSRSVPCSPDRPPGSAPAPAAGRG